MYKILWGKKSGTQKNYAKKNQFNSQESRLKPEKPKN